MTLFSFELEQSATLENQSLLPKPQRKPVSKKAVAYSLIAMAIVWLIFSNRASSKHVQKTDEGSLYIDPGQSLLEILQTKGLYLSTMKGLANYGFDKPNQFKLSRKSIKSIADKIQALLEQESEYSQYLPKDASEIQHRDLQASLLIFLRNYEELLSNFDHSDSWRMAYYKMWSRLALTMSLPSNIGNFSTRIESSQKSFWETAELELQEIQKTKNTLGGQPNEFKFISMLEERIRNLIFNPGSNDGILGTPNTKIDGIYAKEMALLQYLMLSEDHLSSSDHLFLYLLGNMIKSASEVASKPINRLSSEFSSSEVEKMQAFIFDKVRGGEEIKFMERAIDLQSFDYISSISG